MMTLSHIALCVITRRNTTTIVRYVEENGLLKKK